MYVLLHSGNKESNGGRDLHYWVDEEAGVAFKTCLVAEQEAEVCQRDRHLPERVRLPARGVYFDASAVGEAEVIPLLWNGLAASVGLPASPSGVRSGPEISSPASIPKATRCLPASGAG